MAREQFQTLTEQMYYILLALTKECCGVDIMERVDKITVGRVKIGPGTLYTLLARFVTGGMIQETLVEGRKKSYILTEFGREVLEIEHGRLRRLVLDGDNYRAKGEK